MMEQENNFKEAENLAEASNKSHEINNKDAENFAEASNKSHENNNKDAENFAEASNKSHENNNKDAENFAEASNKSQSFEGNIEMAENPVKSSESCEKIQMEGEKLTERLNKAESSKKRMRQSLKAKPKDMKIIPASDNLKDKSVKGNPETRRRRRRRNKNKNALQVSKDVPKNKSEDSRKLNDREEKVERNVSNEDHPGRPQDGKREEGIGRSNNNPGNRKIKEKHISSDRTSRKEKEDRINDKESGHNKKKKGKLAGLIFMCSAKTKPDCFRYHVMGVTSGKKDLVLGVKRGLKLFLYDFDLRLMYGIYEAASSGGMRLEPKAFGGSFPVQVRFSIYKECLPLPESVFKKAIKDNYNGKNKFDIELSDQQVRKLFALFRAKPAVAPVYSSALATVQNREVFERERESRPHSDREVVARSNGDASSYRFLPQERDRHNEYHDVISARREKGSLYMTEKEYRTFGLQGDRRNLVPQQRITSTLDPYPRDQEAELLLRQPPLPMYRDVASLHREPRLIDPLYSSHRESIHNLGSRNEMVTGAPSLSATASVSTITAVDLHPREPYNTYHYAASSVNAYLPTLTREEVPTSSYYADGRRDTYLSSADLLTRRLDADQMDKLCSKYTFEPSSRYSPAQQSSIHTSLSQAYGTRPENAGAISSSIAT